MFRKKFLNYCLHIGFLFFVMVVAVLELVELPFALIQALITDEWPGYAWGLTEKLLGILPKNGDLHEWPLKVK